MKLYYRQNNLVALQELYREFSIEIYCERPNNFSALNAVAKATSSGVLLMKAAIISTIAGREQGSLR